MASNFYSLYKTPNGIFQHLKDVVENNPDIKTRRMFYRRCEKYPEAWSIIKNNIGICKGCQAQFNIDIKQRGYCSSKCRSIHTNYKINIIQYKELLEKQNNKCAICNIEFDSNCKKYKQINIDHNHKTLKVRGILCSPCNRSLGLLKEDIKILESMINYIKKQNNEDSKN